MRAFDELRIWFRLAERLVIFTFGLLFAKGMVTYVLENLITFLTDFWGLKLKVSLAIVNLHDGLRNMLQIYVALCIDDWLGYRRMLILSSALYSAGLVLLSVTLYAPGLALLTVGRITQVIPLYALSFDQTKVIKPPTDSKATRVNFGWCLCRRKENQTKVTKSPEDSGCRLCKVRIGGWRQLQQRIIGKFCTGFLMLGIATSVYIFIFSRDDWDRLFLKSAVAMVIGLFWFLSGLPFYGPPHLQPSPLSTMLRALVAAVRKRHRSWQGNSVRLHHDEEKKERTLTDHLKWLNNAAVKEAPVDDNLTMEQTRWRLCTVEEVEQTKLLLNIIPMSVTFIAYGMVKSLGNTFFIEQVNSMEGGIPIIVYQMIQWFSEVAVKRGYKMVFEKRIERSKKRYSDGVKIGIGMLASIACCAVASSVENKRLKDLHLIIQVHSGDLYATAPAPAPMSVDQCLSDDMKPTAPMAISTLLVLQFFLLGAMEGLAGDGIQDFFGHYAPDSRRYGPVFTRSLTGLGTLLNTGFIFILDYYSNFRYSESWLGDCINGSRLDHIYQAYVIVALLNWFLYAYVASQYSYGNSTSTEAEEEEEIPFLEVKEEETPGGEGDQRTNQGQMGAELRRISVRN